MSTAEDKFKKSRRLLKDENAVKKQVKLAKTFGIPTNNQHKFSKHHALNCGDSKCVLCGNPRKIFKELTTQEKRLYQDTDKTNDKHSNGLLPPEE